LLWVPVLKTATALWGWCPLVWVTVSVTIRVGVVGVDAARESISVGVVFDERLALY